MWVATTPHSGTPSSHFDLHGGLDGVEIEMLYVEYTVIQCTVTKNEERYREIVGSSAAHSFQVTFRITVTLLEKRRNVTWNTQECQFTVFSMEHSCVFQVRLLGNNGQLSYPLFPSNVPRFVFFYSVTRFSRYVDKLM